MFAATREGDYVIQMHFIEVDRRLADSAETTIAAPHS
jgi:hypothetical protein